MDTVSKRYLQGSKGKPDPQESYRGFSHLLGDDWFLSQRRQVWRPPTDVYETSEHIIIKVEMAGMDVDDFQISFADRRLIISGCRRDPGQKVVYQNMEIRYGEFRTEILVGWTPNYSAIEATYNDGFLYVKLPKATEHRIQVRTAGADEADR